MSRWNDQLVGDLTPGDVAADQRAAAIAPVRHRLADIADWYDQLAGMDRAAVTGSAGLKVAVSRTPPVPITIDLADLTGPANSGSVLAAAASPWPEDQVGHLAVASELDFWACDWASERTEQPPAATVAELSAWLDVRLEWAYDHHGAWDEMAASMARIARALYATLTPKRVRVVPVSAPCPRDGCDGVLGRREDGWVECGCGRILSATEYAGWAVSVIHREANGGWGITAAAIAIRAQVPASTVRRWAAVYGWDKTGPEQRPVLYCAEQAEATIARLEQRRKAKEARAA